MRLPPAPRPDTGVAKLAVVLGVVLAVLVGGTGALLLSGSGSSLAAVGIGPTPTSAPPVGFELVGGRGRTVPWSKPLAFTVANGTITAVAVAGPGGRVLPGVLSATKWTSIGSLLPGQAYVLQAQVKDDNGKTSRVARTYRASAADSVLDATLSPGDGNIVGVGQPLVVRFDQQVKGVVARRAVLTRLQVTTTPAVVGAWRWYDSFEVHYRPTTYWKSGTKVGLRADLNFLRLPGTATWGTSRTRTTHFVIGKDYTSLVDVTAHVMTVRLDGKLIRTIRVSTGRDKYPTKGGVHIILDREKTQLYNSATVGIPTASPDGYYEHLPWSMRISNGGAFVHANPATVGVQGRFNVSHGCVNTSVTDAQWFYDHSQLGDVVTIVHAAVGPLVSDAGMYDWNIPWAQWKTGNLNG